jgi:hypothetical protein
MLGTILSVVGGINTAFDLYKNVNTLVKGDGTARVLDELGRLRQDVVKLNDHIFYAPGVRGLTDTAAATHLMSDPRTARELLDPVQRAVGGDIVASGLIGTPHKMEQALISNPWAVLTDIRPEHLATQPSNPDMVPVMFAHGGVRYIGWQMRGTLPILFNCELRDLPGLEVTGVSEGSVFSADLDRILNS